MAIALGLVFVILGTFQATTSTSSTISTTISTTTESIVTATTTTTTTSPVNIIQPSPTSAPLSSPTAKTVPNGTTRNDTPASSPANRRSSPAVPERVVDFLTSAFSSMLSNLKEILLSNDTTAENTNPQQTTTTTAVPTTGSISGGAQMTTASVATTGNTSGGGQTSLNQTQPSAIQATTTTMTPNIASVTTTTTASAAQAATPIAPTSNITISSGTGDTTLDNGGGGLSPSTDGVTGRTGTTAEVSTSRTEGVLNSLKNAFNSLLNIVGDIVDDASKDKATNGTAANNRSTTTTVDPATSAAQVQSTISPSTTTVAITDTTAAAAASSAAITTSTPPPTSQLRVTTASTPAKVSTTTRAATTTTTRTTRPATTTTTEKTPAPIIIMVVKHPYLSNNGYTNNDRHNVRNGGSSLRTQRRHPMAFFNQQDNNHRHNLFGPMQHRPALHNPWDVPADWLTEYEPPEMAGSNGFSLSQIQKLFRNNPFRRSNSVQPHSLSSWQARKHVLGSRLRPTAPFPITPAGRTNTGALNVANPKRDTFASSSAWAFNPAFWKQRAPATTTTTTTTTTVTTTTTTTKPPVRALPKGPVPVDSTLRRLSLTRQQRPNPWYSPQGFWDFMQKYGDILRALET